MQVSVDLTERPRGFMGKAPSDEVELSRVVVLEPYKLTKDSEDFANTEGRRKRERSKIFWSERARVSYRIRNHFLSVPKA